MERQELQDLIRKYLDQQATDEEKEKLRQWFHSVDDTLVEWPASSPGEEEEISTRMLARLRQLPGLSAPRIRRVWTAAAAVMILLAGMALVVYQAGRQRTNAYTSVVNPPGSVARLTLPDGSQVWLNANSSLRYPSAFGEDRSIEMEGEAFFDVRPGIHPFVVHSGKLETRVLGTSFNVKAYVNGPGIQVAVRSGKVLVHDAGAGRDIGVVLPGQEALYDLVSTRAVVRNTPPADQPEWKNGELSFRFQTLDQICRQLENWYGYTFRFSDPSLRSYEYNASFRNTITLNALLTILCEINDIRWAIDEHARTVIFSGKRSH
jgi:transmembrane sensor